MRGRCLSPFFSTLFIKGCYFFIQTVEFTPFGAYSLIRGSTLKRGPVSPGDNGVPKGSVICV